MILRPTLETIYSTSEAMHASILETNVTSTNNCLFKVPSITVIYQQINSLYDIMDKNKSPIKPNTDHPRTLLINFQSSTLRSENDTDIVLGSKTYLNKHIFDKEILHPAYTCYRMGNDANGGAIIITKNGVNCGRSVYCKNMPVFVAVKIETDNQALILATAYRSPNSTVNKTICIELMILNNKYKRNALLFGDDMNLPDIEWSTNSITKYQYLRQINESFVETFNVLIFCK